MIGRRGGCGLGLGVKSWSWWWWWWRGRDELGVGEEEPEGRFLVGYGAEGRLEREAVFGIWGCRGGGYLLGWLVGVSVSGVGIFFGRGLV